MARCAPPVTAAASPPPITSTHHIHHLHAALSPRSSSYREPLQAVRLELLAEKSAIHADRVMKDLAATPPCNRLQAAALRASASTISAPLFILYPPPSLSRSLSPSLPLSLSPSFPPPPSLSLPLPRSPSLALALLRSLLSFAALPRSCRSLALSLLSAFDCLLFFRGTRSTPRHRCRLPLRCSRP